MTDHLITRVEKAAQRAPSTVGADQKEHAPGIDGVQMLRLAQHVDHRGSLMPMMDTRQLFWTEPVVYGYAITIAPGRIKGWGMHEHQTDRYVVHDGDVRVALFDGRADSPTHGISLSIFFSTRTPGAVLIPPGVWHADQNYGDEEALILNFPTRAYDPAHPDKFHIDVESDGIPFDWTLRDY